jgi:hypothetical protein
MSKESTKWDDDVFNRKHYADFLTKNLLNGKKSFVLNIDAAWGSGKTFFLKHWYEDVKQEHPSIYFDAWKTDYSQNPFISITSSFLKALVEYLPEKEREEKRKNIYNKVGSILSHTLPIVLKSLVKKHVGEEGTEAITGIGSDTEDAMANSTEEIAKELLKGHSKTQDAIIEFKDIINNIILDINEKGDVKIPLFVFIDELDRCRPTYAIELLENIKHLFDIDNIIFVIATDTTQLASAVKSVYGESFESELYLKRFFDQSYTLPDPSVKEFTDLLFSKLEYPERSPFWIPITPNSKASNLDEPKRIIAMVSSTFNLKLRDQEQCFFRLQSLINTFPEHEKIHICFLYHLIVLHHIHGNNFKRLIQKIPVVDEPISIAVYGETFSLSSIIQIYHRLYTSDLKGIDQLTRVSGGHYTFENHLAEIVGRQSYNNATSSNILQKYPDLVLLAGSIH